MSPAPTPPANSVHQRVSAVGRGTRSFFDQIGAGTRFVVATFTAMRDTKDWIPEFSTHARILGVESLPIGIFIALFTGIVLALLASYSVGDLVPPYFVGTLVQKTITLELALLAVVMATIVAVPLGVIRSVRVGPVPLTAIAVSNSAFTAVAVTGLVMEAIQKIESVAIGVLFSMSASPVAERWRIFSSSATSVTAPEISFASTKFFIRPSTASITGGAAPSLALRRCNTDSTTRPSLMKSLASSVQPEVSSFG